MNIGILAYCSACNFGAQLQLLSTYRYLINKGYSPIVIDWMPNDLNDSYLKNHRGDVLELFQNERNRMWRQTRRCITDEDVSKVIQEYSIDAIIIGSDAVAQHRPLFERISFPTRRFISISHPTADKMFPSPFWGTFNDFLENSIPYAIMSASSQDSKYYLIPEREKKVMQGYITKARYYSVRDDWTQKMIKSITNGKIVPKLTPDPVFAFNYNVGDFIPSEEEIRQKYKITQKYVIISFHEEIVNQDWINGIKKLFNDEGVLTLNLPYADHNGFGNMDINVSIPIAPLDWYALIKYSIGYIGENMHPIVSAIHNGLPVYAFDNYGLKILNGIFTSDKSSKIKHILKMVGIADNRMSCVGHFFKVPSASEVHDKFISSDTHKIREFSEFYLKEYKIMMRDIEKALGL